MEFGGSVLLLPCTSGEFILPKPWICSSRRDWFYWFPLDLKPILCMQRDGSGCPIFRWEEEYVSLLKRLKKEGKLEVEDGVLDDKLSEVKSKKKGKHVDQQSVMLLQVVSLLKAILIVCACILLVMLFMLFVILNM